MNKKILLLILFGFLSFYVFLEYGNFLFALQIFDGEQISGNIHDMNCLLVSPIENLINDLKSVFSLSIIKENCDIYYTKSSYLKNFFVYLSLNFIKS